MVAAQVCAPLFAPHACASVPRPSGPPVAVVALRANDAAPPDLAAVEARVRGAVDAAFSGRRSLLTPERVARIRAAFGEATLPLDRAYAALFSRVGLGADYGLDDFRGDVRAFRESDDDGGGAMGVEEALAFVRWGE